MSYFVRLCRDVWYIIGGIWLGVWRWEVDEGWM